MKKIIKKSVLIGIGLFVMIMFILPFSYFLATGEFPKGYPIPVGKKEIGEKEAGIKYVCPDGNVVTSPELCPKKEQSTTEIMQANQTLMKGGIELNLGIVQEDVKTYLASWYNKIYPILENTTGGPCKPFTANVVYSSVGAGGRFEEGSGIGGGANLIFSMPLDKSKTYDPNFDSRFGHEFSHGFMNGIHTIETTPSGAKVTISFINEGFAEVTISSALLELIKKGKTDYEKLHFYLPYAIASYDSYAIQGKNTAGGALMWKAETTGYYYLQAEAVWYLLEQAKPGFTKQFLRETCSLPQIRAGNWKGIDLTYDKFKDIVKKIFGSEKIEGKPVLEWLASQPITNFKGESGNYIRVQFRDKATRETVYRDEGRSINPKVLVITAVRRTQDPVEGAKDTMVDSSPSIKLTDWQGKITN
ncbi:hypothetical protein HZA75_04730, partial [Candidatus Roizmanbacteria bacterium]|nr:hypothetical protein [Candidatus Roizmanbacteria bacterium]